jgi:hypothetical protein
MQRVLQAQSAWPCCEGFFSPRAPLSPAAFAIA